MHNSVSTPYVWILLLVSFVIALIALVFALRARQGGAPHSLLSRHMEELEKITGRLDELRTIFFTPHVRGGIGETLLEELIRNWLPPKAYSFQYAFRNGSRADAVINLGSYIVAIDSKFPLESISEVLEKKNSEEVEHKRTLPATARRTLISHAKTIAEKYIRPEEGTLQFALMYIPSEHIYYRCFVEDNSLMEEVLSLNIVPAGPSSLFLYIQTVAYGLRGFAFPQRARELTELSYQLKREIEALESDLSTISTHLKNLNGSFDSLHKREARLLSIAEKITSPDPGEE